MLGLCCELADRHVFDHALTQRANGLLGHGDAPVLSEGCQPLISRQDAPIRYLMSCTRGGTAAPYRASGLVHWPDPEAPTASPAGPLTEVDLPCRRSEWHGSF